MGDCYALIVAAGRGRRFGGPLPKQYRALAGEAILRRTARAFARHAEIKGVRVVIHPDDRDLYDPAAEGLGLMEPAPGGATRQESVRLGLESLEGLAPSKVLIHDGARPFPSSETISRVIAALDDAPGAIPALPVVDTLKRGADGAVADTVDRSGLWRAQTPQGFRFDDIMEAHRRFEGRELTDDAAVAEQAGLGVALVAGNEENVKVTTEEDLARAESRLNGWEFRVGTGFDVHKFGEGDYLTLCGISITHDHGLIGHSDADVALHALTDALLGAVAAGDIGVHFPPSDPQWKGASSRLFLEKARDLVYEQGGVVVNVDLSIICEKPRISPHREAMVHFVAGVLGISEDRVSVKGKTTEGLGFTGRAEGVAAQAVASVRLPSQKD